MNVQNVVIENAEQKLMHCRIYREERVRLTEKDR